MDYEDSVQPSPGHPRKRKRRPEVWKNNVAKKLRHSGACKVPVISCSHDGSSGSCQAYKLLAADLERVHKSFYEDSDTRRQESYLLKNITSCVPKRKRVRNNNGDNRNRSCTYKYTVPVGNNQGCITVCLKSFLSIYNVKQTKVRSIMKVWDSTGTIRKDNRGGPRLQNDKNAIKLQVREYIGKLMCKSSHYGRSKTPHRKYLPSYYTIKGLWEGFTESTGLACSYMFFYGIFTRDFNLGFGSPAKDVCATCIGMKNKIAAEQNAAAKRLLVAKLLVHKAGAKRFYTLLNDFDNQDPSVLTIYFDLMQNQELPRTTVGEAYYARQLWQYFFSIVNHHGESSRQTKEDVYFYTWGEHEAGRGSNVLGSALHDYLTKYVRDEVKSLRLFSDSCGGQNKNYPIMAMLSSYSKQSGKNIQYYFSIRGHSYLPADRAFGRAEKQIRKNDTILTPAGYYANLNKVGTVKVIGQDFPLHDWKSYKENTLKSKSDFKISEAKVLDISRSNNIGMKTTYSGEFCYHNVLKRGKSWLPVNILALPMESHVTADKRKDVKNLLDVIGINANHEAMIYYSASLK